MDSNEMLENIIYSSSEQKVLAFLLENPSVKFYDREISRLSGIKKSSTNYSIRALVGSGIVQKEKLGRMFFYHISLENPLVRHLKITLNLIRLAPLAGKLKQDALEVILYGKGAAGRNYSEDCLDLFIVTQDTEKTAAIVEESGLSDALLYMVKTPREYLRIKADNPILSAAISAGIKL